MQDYDLFGEPQPQLTAAIEAAGGASTPDGRELMITYAIQGYVAEEARNGTTIDMLMGRLSRVIARSIASTAATISANANTPIPEACAYMYGILSGDIETALDELERAQAKATTVIHRDHGRRN